MKNDAVYIADINQALDRIFTYTHEGKGSFLKNVQIQDAVLRNFQVMGEAARRVSDTTQKKYSEVPWSDLIGFRNVVIHDYGELDLERLWDTIEKEVSALQKQIGNIAADASADDEDMKAR